MKERVKQFAVSMFLWIGIYGFESQAQTEYSLIEMRGTVEVYSAKKRVLVMNDRSLLIQSDVRVTENGVPTTPDAIHSGQKVVLKGVPPSNPFGSVMLEVTQIDIQSW